MPVDGEKDGRVTEDREVEAVVGVLPDVLAAENNVLAKGLLNGGVEFIAEAGLEATGNARGAAEDALHAQGKEGGER